MNSVLHQITPDINEILKIKNLIANFQPILSFSRKTVIGLEGLVRGIDIETNQVVSPLTLFDLAKKEGVTLELDRVCRDTVLEAFSSIYKNDKNILLFINLETSVLDRVAGSNYLLNQVKSYNINPRNIVIEISESRVEDIDVLKKFSDTYRKLGFMVALDDVGTGFSNMDRLSLVRPDIIKIDSSLISNITNDFYKQGVFKSLISLSNTIGALTIAEGIETEEDAIQIIKLGGSMMQGYFFAKPLMIYDAINISFKSKIDLLSQKFNRVMRIKINEDKKNSKHLNKIVNSCVNVLAGVSSHEFDNKLLQITWSYTNIECAYILNQSGIQVSNTIRFCDENAIKDNLIFYSARAGTDHTVEKYYYPMMSARLRKYITEPYVSLATGNLCVTISRLFTNLENQKYILCLDFNATDQAFDLEATESGNISNLVFNINGKSITEINKIIVKMNEEIIKDSLTNTYNRRYMEERLLVDVFNATKVNQPISVILADIDFFKLVNDSFGHLAGDHVLKEFVKIAQKNIRQNKDWIARYGGEEFLIVLLNADVKEAYLIAEKIRRSIEKAKIIYKQNTIQITASFGVYTLNSNSMTYEQLVDLADKNLYLAKNSGRNKTVS
jgi:diguanylate cyclase (GGDEF)-like protein